MDQLDRIVEFAVQRDPEAFNKMILSGQCIMMKPGVPVYIMDTKIFSGSVKIRPKGETAGLWVIREAIQETKPIEKPSKINDSQISNKDIFVKIKIENLKCYEFTDINSKVISIIPSSTFLISKSHTKNWYKVNTPDGQCWIKASGLDVIK